MSGLELGGTQGSRQRTRVSCKFKMSAQKVLKVLISILSRSAPRNYLYHSILLFLILLQNNAPPSHLQDVNGIPDDAKTLRWPRTADLGLCSLMRPRSFYSSESDQYPDFHLFRTGFTPGRSDRPVHIPQGLSLFSLSRIAAGKGKS